MILTDYYRFEHLPDCKSKTRRDCTNSTKGYPEFEGLRNKGGELFVHYGDVPMQFGGDAHRKADKAISKTKNISSVFFPDVTLQFAHGDFKGTADALLIVITPDESVLEIFVVRGQKCHSLNLWQMLCDGELDYEIAAMRGSAITESVMKKQE